MKFTIVADDKAVGIDEEFFPGLSLPELDPTIHAIQWYGEHGEVEFKTVFANGALTKPQNQLITDIAPFQFAVDAWQAAKDAQIAEEQSRIIPVTEV